MAEPTPPQDQAPAGPRQFTPEELEEARRQIAAQDATVGGPPVDPEGMGVDLLSKGAEAADPDTSEMLAAIRALQAKVDKLQADARTEQAPQVVKYAEAIRDHLQAKANANPAIHAVAETSWAPGLEKAAAVVEQAGQAAEHGHTDALHKGLADVEKWVVKFARKLPAIDHGYVLELIEEAGEAALKLAA